MRRGRNSHSYVVALPFLWREVAHMLTGILNVDIRFYPKICLLGANIGNIQIDKQQRVIALVCLAAKHLIVKNCNVRKPSCFSRDRWLHEFLHLLILRYLDMDTSDRWDTIRSFLDMYSSRINCMYAVM